MRTFVIKNKGIIRKERSPYYTYRSCLALETHGTSLLVHSFHADVNARGRLNSAVIEEQCADYFNALCASALLCTSWLSACGP